MDSDLIDILCIEDYIKEPLYSGNNITATFEKGKWYTLCICEREEPRDDGQLVFFDLYEEGIRFPVTIYDVAIFDKHFITKAEFREERLNKILE